MGIKASVKDFLKNSSTVKKIIEKVNVYSLSVPPGHFYSPIPKMDDVRRDDEGLFNKNISIEGIDFNDVRQLELLEKFRSYQNIIPFTDSPTSLFRYYYENEMYSHSSGSLLFSFLHYLKPKRIIEIGSGFSSALMLDVNNISFENSIKLTFIEPNPERLKGLLKEEDYKNATIIEKRVQDIDINIYAELEDNDILFIDSTHVSKIGSDVNKVIFEIIPRLKKGVYIHFHDILYPFEYPRDWIYKGVFWNESYILRAFLMYNTSFSIQFFNTYLLEKYFTLMQDIPLFNKSIGGCFWMRKEK
ncbi:MAG: class I SAM-dependent methyltransferase [Agriterribacter sp.]